MSKLTSKELDGRIRSLYFVDEFDDVNTYQNAVRQLIRDCIEAVTPERSEDPNDDNDEFYKAVYNLAIDTIEANTKELLG